ARAVSVRGGSKELLPQILLNLMSAESHSGQESFLRLGNLFLDGLGVPANPMIAAKLFSQRAEEGDPAAAGMLAVLHIRGVGVPLGLEQARRFLEAHSASSAPEIAYGRALLNRALGKGRELVEQDLALADASGLQMASFELALSLLADPSRAAEGWSKIE